jgi:predicted RNA binding protein YcfA (HicA-like mRNA interferase family)
MPRLTPLKPKEVIEKLHRLGYDGPFPGGRHSRMVHPSSGKIIPIPIHGGRDVSIGVIRAIIREVGITPEAWLDL